MGPLSTAAVRADRAGESQELNLYSTVIPNHFIRAPLRCNFKNHKRRRAAEMIGWRSWVREVVGGRTTGAPPRMRREDLCLQWNGRNGRENGSGCASLVKTVARQGPGQRTGSGQKWRGVLRRGNATIK